jgi:putative spermidine/putrescine transport system permease protein
MARVASPRARNLLVVAVLMPLWASYLVKAYAWRTILSGPGSELGARPARALVPGLLGGRPLARLHLPLAAVHDPAGLRGLERIPDSLLEASQISAAARCGRSGASRCRSRFPASSPARSSPSRSRSATTSRPKLITSQQFIGTVIYDNHGTNLPSPAAFTLVPIVVMVVYLLVAQRLHAFDAL